jgi:hypothetical protein
LASDGVSREGINNCSEFSGFEECIGKSLEKVDDEEFKRARLGGGHPPTSSSELDEASIAWRLTKNDS